MIEARFVRIEGAVLFLLAIVIPFLSCVGKMNGGKEEGTPHDHAVRALGEKLAAALRELDQATSTDNRSPIDPKSYLIYNRDAMAGEERELARRFIEDLGEFLGGENIRIKRKEAATRPWRQGGTSRVKCSGVLETLAPDYLIEFHLREYADRPHWLKASAKVVRIDDNELKFVGSAGLRLTHELRKSYEKWLLLPGVKGTRENPHRDLDEAVGHLTGKLACTVKSLLEVGDAEPIHVIIGKTSEIPTDSPFPAAAGQAALEYGFMHVPTERWLTVHIMEGDRLEQNMFMKKHRKKYPTADILIALDERKSGEGPIRLEARLMNFDSLTMKMDGKKVEIPPNVTLLRCVAAVYFEDVLIVKAKYREGRDTSAREANEGRFIDEHVIPWLESGTSISPDKIKSVVNTDRADWIPPRIMHRITGREGGDPSYIYLESRLNKKRFNSWIRKKLVDLQTEHLPDSPAWWKPHVRAGAFAAYGDWENAMMELKSLMAGLRAQGMDRNSARVELRKANYRFVNFSPRRDLRIAYYHLGKTGHAIEELIASMEA